MTLHGKILLPRFASNAGEIVRIFLGSSELFLGPGFDLEDILDSDEDVDDSEKGIKM
jgi:hypothetical protein